MVLLLFTSFPRTPFVQVFVILSFFMALLRVVLVLQLRLMLVVLPAGLALVGVGASGAGSRESSVCLAVVANQCPAA